MKLIMVSLHWRGRLATVFLRMEPDGEGVYRIDLNRWHELVSAMFPGNGPGVGDTVSYG